MEECIVVLRDWAIYWNPENDVEILAGFRSSGEVNSFTISSPINSDLTPLPGSFFSTENGLVFGWKGKANLDLCFAGMNIYIDALERQLEDIDAEDSGLHLFKELAFLKDCIILSNLSDYEKQKIIEKAILYPCESGGYRILDENSKIMTSNIIAVDLQNNFFLTESGKVYAYDQILLADLESQALKAFPRAV